MKIGLSPLQGQASFEQTLRECEHAEAAGFDSIWLGEHHNHPLLYPAPLIALSAIASRTRSIRLGTGVLLLPFYHPVTVAEEAAMVDVISGGRLILGIGAGYAPEEFAAFGVSVKERGTRVEEGAALLERLWTEENVTHCGRHYQLENVTIAPKPLQRPRPPIWFGAWVEPAIRRAARLGDAWLIGPSASLDEIAPCRKPHHSGGPENVYRRDHPFSKSVGRQPFHLPLLGSRNSARPLRTFPRPFYSRSHAGDPLVPKFPYTQSMNYASHVFAFLLLLIAPPQKEQAWTANIDQIRQAARMIPGRTPLRINVLKFAESRRAKKFSVKGAPDEPSVQARTVFQIMYADGYIMLDSGMDQQVHNFFGRGVVEPYDPEAAKQVERAVRGARAIIVTHEHGDHVAGVIHTPFANELASKTILTRDQVQTLLTNPQMPEIRLSPEVARRYHVVDYEKYLPFAPGIVLVKAPGHTPGSQMGYVVLASGREYLFIGDTAWHMDGVRNIKGKDAPWIQEDEKTLIPQLSWLNGLSRTEENLFIIASHDDEQRLDLVKRGILGNKLE